MSTAVFTFVFSWKQMFTSFIAIIHTTSIFSISSHSSNIADLNRQMFGWFPEPFNFIYWSKVECGSLSFFRTNCLRESVDRLRKNCNLFLTVVGTGIIWQTMFVLSPLPLFLSHHCTHQTTWLWHRCLSVWYVIKPRWDDIEMSGDPYGKIKMPLSVWRTTAAKSKWIWWHIIECIWPSILRRLVIMWSVIWFPLIY